jgi:hypothetical protein
MDSKKYLKLFLLIPLFILFYSGIDPKESRLNKPFTNDHFNFIAVNEIMMWISNNGDGSHDPQTDGNGFYWPGGKLARKAAVFEDGLIWGGKIDGQIRVNGTTHRQGLQAGKILSSGLADNPDNPTNRVYKIRKGWEDFPAGPERDAFEKDYQDWLVNDGAPWVDIDGDGVYSPGMDTPEFIGDEVLWYVANDLDTSRTRRTYGSDPIGLEFQTTAFAFNRVNDLADIVFKKYLIINMGSNTIEDMIFGYWADSDLGDASDDFVGCDTILNLGYTWNGDNNDGDGSGIQYGTPPPAVGHLLLQGPVVKRSVTDSARFNGKWLSGYKNLQMTSFSPNFKGFFSMIHDPPQGVLQGSIEFYNLLQGKTNAGEFLIDPYTSDSTIFPLAGDPVNSIGWYEGHGWPGGPDSDDRRLFSLLRSGHNGSR